MTSSWSKAAFAAAIAIALSTAARADGMSNSNMGSGPAASNTMGSDHMAAGAMSTATTMGMTHKKPKPHHQAGTMSGAAMNGPGAMGSSNVMHSSGTN